MIAYWDDNGPMFPVNQKDRNWSNNNSMQTFENGNSINPYLLRQITGVSDFDPTTILLSADFLKILNGALPLEFSAIRDYMFNNILKRPEDIELIVKIEFNQVLQKEIKF